MTPARRGFTLIELLVVIAIIGIMISLLLPAVQKVREAASKARCQNNLKQCSLALENYETQMGLYPYNGQLYRASFWVPTLPFLEQSTILTMYANRSNPNSNKKQSHPHRESNDVGGCPRLKVVECPSTPPTTANFDGTGMDDHIWRNSVGAVYGITDYQRVKSAVGLGTFGNGQLVDGPGLLVMEYRNKITDGMSNTISLFEMAGKQDWYLNGVRQIGGGNAQVGLWCSDKMEGRISGTHPTRRTPETPDDDIPNTCAINCDNELYPYSFHSGGANFAFADGSVRFINEKVDIGLLAALATYNGGEAIGGDGY